VRAFLRKLLGWQPFDEPEVVVVAPGEELRALIRELPRGYQRDVLNRSVNEVYGFAADNAKRVNAIRRTVQRMYRTNTIGLIIIALVLLLAAAIAIRNTIDLSNTADKTSRLASANSMLVRRVIRDEDATCLIQARGLPAGHQLAATMRDIHTILTLPPTPGAAPTPPAVSELITDLNQHLSAYLKAEKQQPQERSCAGRGP
jgi:hypothetical protein